MSQPPRPAQPKMQRYSSAGGACSVPGMSGPMPWRKIASPPIAMVSRVAPWKESHMEIVLCRPVAIRASFSAMPTASAPPGQKSDFFKGSGAISASFFARSTATRLV